MRQAARRSPVNSLVLIHGGRGDITPLPIWGARILATNSCVSVACYPEVDGPTDIVLGDAGDVGLDRPPDFEGILRTPERKIVITTVDDQTVLNMPVAAKLTIVKIWRSHPRWPEIVTVGSKLRQIWMPRSGRRFQRNTQHERRCRFLKKFPAFFCVMAEPRACIATSIRGSTRSSCDRVFRLPSAIQSS